VSDCRAEVRRAASGGVHLIVTRDGREDAAVWFPGAATALTDPRGRAFTWRASTAIGSSTLYRGDLRSWEEEGGGG